MSFIVYSVGIDKRRCYLAAISGLSRTRQGIYFFLLLVRNTLKEKAMSATKHSTTIPFGPSAPQLTLKNLRDQFWADLYGKEVQTTATYSYTWVADQFGSGGPADWLKRYIPRSSKQRSRQMQEPAEVEPLRAYPHTASDLPAGRASVI
jgi:hypothetical protein